MATVTASEAPYLLSVKEAADLLRVGVTTVAELIRTDPTFPSVKVGRRRLVKREALLAWIDRDPA